MYYLVNISKKNFGRIIAEAESLMAIDFHRNFTIKSQQAHECDLMVVDVTYDDMFASYGAQPYVASWEGPEPTDPWSAGNSAEEALHDFIELMERHYA